MHFDKGNTPPVGAFLSISMYNATNYMFVTNSIDRHSLGNQKDKFVYNSDSSLDIYIQHDKPPGKELNWLPAPENEFYLILRMAKPGPEILNETYQIPQVQKVV
jgi:hypothetical protein